MKKIPKIMGLLCIILILLTSCKGEESDTNVASVNDTKISKDSYESSYEFFTNYYLVSQPQVVNQQSQNSFNMKDAVMDYLIKTEIVQQDLSDKGIQISQGDIEVAVDENIAALGGETDYQVFLDSYRITDAQYRDFIRSVVLLEKHKEFYVAREMPSLTGKDKEKYYKEKGKDLEQIQLQVIVTDSQLRAQKALTMLEGGATFEETVREYSIEALSKKEDGNLGYVIRSSLKNEAAEKLFAMNTGEISDPILDGGIYRIYKVLDKKVDYLSLEPSIVLALREENYNKYIKKLIFKSNITLWKI